MNRAEILRARRKRKRILLTFLFSVAFSAMVAAGVGLGAAVGVAAERVPQLVSSVRESPAVAKVLPPKAPPLPSTKVQPPDPVDTSGPAVACAAQSVTLAVSTDRAEVDAGTGVYVHVTVTHTGRVPCLVNGGLENLHLRLVDAKGVAVWTSADCGYTGTRKLLMGPGYNFAWDVSWDGQTSAPGVCQTGQPMPAGIWQLIASLGEVAYSDSEPATIIVHGTPAPAPEPAAEAILELAPEPVPEQLPDVATVPDAPIIVP